MCSLQSVETGAVIMAANGRENAPGWGCVMHARSAQAQVRAEAQLETHCFSPRGSITMFYTDDSDCKRIKNYASRIQMRLPMWRPLPHLRRPLPHLWRPLPIWLPLRRQDLFQVTLNLCWPIDINDQLIMYAIAAECESWCMAHGDVWSIKCTWSEMCDGCPQCGCPTGFFLWSPEDKNRVFTCPPGCTLDNLGGSCLRCVNCPKETTDTPVATTLTTATTTAPAAITTGNVLPAPSL